jgi:hypothetical protein
MGFFGGVLWRVENHYQFLRLQHLFLEGPSHYLRIADSFLEKTNLRFFPDALFSFVRVARDMERQYPVDVSYRYTPWRSYSLRVKPLTIFTQIYWNDVLWNVSRNGRAWEFSQDDVTSLSPNILRVIWGEGLNPPIALPRIPTEEQRVCSVLAPLDTIERYMQALSKGSLFREIPAFTIQKRGTRFEVLLDFEETIIVLDGDRPELWARIDQAVQALLKELGSSRKVRLDAIYPDKIIVQELY